MGVRAVDYETAHIDERHAMYFTPDGTMQKFNLNETEHAMMMTTQFAARGPYCARRSAAAPTLAKEKAPSRGSEGAWKRRRDGRLSAPLHAPGRGLRGQDC